MNKHFAVRLFGFFILTAGLFLMLYIRHSAALGEYMVSKLAISIASLQTQLQSNGGGSVYVGELSTINNFSAASQFLGAQVNWLYLIFAFGVLLIVAPQWFVRLLELGSTPKADRQHGEDS